MLNAATLALFEQASPGVDFVPHDTRGSAAGAAEAARAAVSEGARVMVGPLTSGETGGAAAVSRAASIPMLAFTNDANVAGNGVWTLGVTPAQQVRRLISAATTAGVRRIGLAAPNGAYAQQLAATLRTASQEAGLLPPLISTYPAGALPPSARISRPIASASGTATGGGAAGSVATTGAGGFSRAARSLAAMAGRAPAG